MDSGRDRTPRELEVLLGGLVVGSLNLAFMLDWFRDGLGRLAGRDEVEGWRFRSSLSDGGLTLMISFGPPGALLWTV